MDSRNINIETSLQMRKLPCAFLVGVGVGEGAVCETTQFVDHKLAGIHVYTHNPERARIID